MTPSHPGSLAEALWPHAGMTREVVLVLGGSLLVALAAQAAVQLPFSPVPITGQSFGVLWLGALLGSRRGAATMLTYLAEGALGLPVFAGGTSGFARLLGPTGGYLLGFLAAAFVVGWLCERGWGHRLPTVGAALLLGNAVIYLFGLPWLALYVGLDRVLGLGLLPFIPGDVVKLAVAALALPGGWALVHRVKGGRGE